MYTYSSIQDKKDYAFDNAVDVYAFYFASAFVIEVIGIGLQIHNMGKNFLSQKQNIIIAVIVGLFQMADLFVFGILAG